MQATICLDELSQKEDTIVNRISSIPWLIKNIFLGIFVFFALKYVARNLKKVFNSPDYDDFIDSMSEKEMRDLLDKLKELAQKTEKIQDSLSREIKFYYQPLLKSSLKTVIEINDLVHEKIEDFELSLNPKFKNSIEKILDGLINSKFDINKVKKVESIL